jgi:hypothetical protein
VVFDQTVDLTEDVFQARKIFLVRGELVDGGPDHYDRLEAVKLFIRLISLTQVIGFRAAAGARALAEETTYRSPEVSDKQSLLRLRLLLL